MEAHSIQELSRFEIVYVALAEILTPTELRFVHAHSLAGHGSVCFLDERFVISVGQDTNATYRLKPISLDYSSTRETK